MPCSMPDLVAVSRASLDSYRTVSMIFVVPPLSSPRRVQAFARVPGLSNSPSVLHGEDGGLRALRPSQCERKRNRIAGGDVGHHHIELIEAHVARCKPRVRDRKSTRLNSSH